MLEFTTRAPLSGSVKTVKSHVILMTSLYYWIWKFVEDYFNFFSSNS